ncbi:DUF4097 family beta strand repeat-containing protein [Streptomyces sp. NPDC001262]|uniref:DUF4097 family beta strand repeat-containing protein n=1 Tax=Streptomyces sp. NPDC001262 TaxID=3364552 RepID=UPI0036D1BBDE
MAERIFVSESTGPIVLGLDLPMGSVHVQVLDSVTTARVVLRTDDSSGPAAEAVKRARSSQNGQAMTVEVPEIPGNVMMQSVHGGQVVQSMGTVYGSVTGMTIINGRVITGGGTAVMETVSAIEAVVTLPAGSSLAVVSQSADARVRGDVERMEFRSVSGDLAIDGVRILSASTTSGDVTVGRLTECLAARSVSGDITVRGYSGSGAELNTTSGDIVVCATSQAAGALRANTISGDVQVGGGRELQVSAHSVSGRVHTR